MICPICTASVWAVFTCEDGKDRCFTCKKAFRPAPKCARKAELRTAALERYRASRQTTVTMQDINELSKVARDHAGGKLQHVAIRPGPNKEYEELKKRVGL